MQITHEAERHLSQSRKEDDDDEDDDKGSIKEFEGKACHQELLFAVYGIKEGYSPGHRKKRFIYLK